MCATSPAADLRGIDAVIHLAALSNDPLGNLNPDITYAINHRGSVHLAKLAKDAGVKRVLLASSCSNYGLAGDDMVDETSPLNPVTPYGDSKVKAEHDICLGGRWVLPRLFAAGDRLRCFPANALRHRPQQSDGLRCHQRNHLSQVGWNSLETDRAYRGYIPRVHRCARGTEEVVFNEAFNVGRTAHNYRMRDIADIVAAVVPGCRIEVAPDAGPDKRSYRVSFEKIARVLPAFKPQWNARLAPGSSMPPIGRLGASSKSLKDRAISASAISSA